MVVSNHCCFKGAKTTCGTSVSDYKGRKTFIEGVNGGCCKFSCLKRVMAKLHNKGASACKIPRICCFGSGNMCSGVEATGCEGILCDD